MEIVSKSYIFFFRVVFLYMKIKVFMKKLLLVFLSSTWRVMSFFLLRR